MAELDYFIIAVITLSSFISVVRGFLKEALSLGGWILAGTVTLMLSPRLSVFLSGFVDSPTIRIAITAVVLFVLVLFAGDIVNHLIHKAMARVGLSGTDRLLGVVFGIARGVIILVVLVMLAGLTPLPREHWWQASFLIDYFVFAAIWLQSHLPAELAQYLSFS